MRALAAAAIGLAAALALAFALTALGSQEGETSPRPLLTTAPAAPGQR
ncbi:SPW_0924 family protein [Streptomyces sp. NPDC127106]